MERALIFVHGSGENSNIWENQFKLNLDCTLIAIDLPSHAQSEYYQELSLDLYIETIDKLIEALNLEKVIVCGHSLGGAIALSYYLLNQKKVEGLILIGSGARLRVSSMIFDTLKSDFQAFLESTKVGAFYRKTDKKIMMDFIKEIEKTNPEVTYIDFSICDNFDVISEIKSGKIKIPCLIICGKEDKLTPPKYSTFFHENIKDSDLTIINNAGHMVMIEKPEEVNLSIEKFIQNLNAERN